MKAIKYLSWDSNFFNKKIGLVDCVDFECSDLEFKNLITEAKKSNYQLLYVFTSQNYLPIDTGNYNLKLVDEKIIYTRIIDKNSTTLCFEDVIIYSSNDAVDSDLLSLSYQSGEYSRFKTDKKFAKDDFFRLYKRWIEKSVSREIADKVFITKKDDKITGMVTLSYKSDHAAIGLIAVNNLYRGKAYGTQLLHACFDDILKNKIKRIDVVTQKNNINACRFYEKNGFEIKDVTNVYHLWI